MKILEYIDSVHFLNENNCMQLLKFQKIIKNIISKDNQNKYIGFEYSEDFLEYNDIIDIFNNLKNRIVLLYNVDIDFPPPKKPYNYDKYFNKYILPDNYEEINYYDKVNNDLIPIIEKNNIHVITYSLSINHKNLLFLPLGVYHNFNHFYLKQNNKDILCYLNFGIHCDRWYGNPRNKVLELLKNKQFIIHKNGLDTFTFYSDISKSKFAICPRGCGIDTYRLWDCIALGCIPIVEKYDSHEQFSDLPILFLNRIEDYADLNEDYLNETYKIFLKMDFNYDKCKMEYWENKMNNYNM